jgi:hypothetical protein
LKKAGTNSRLLSVRGNSRVDNVALLAFRRNTQQGLVFGKSANTLEIVEILLCRRRRHHSHNRHIVPTLCADISLPSAGGRIVVNALESLRPMFSFVFIYNDEPDFMIFGHVFQRAADRTALRATAVLDRTKVPILNWLSNFDLLTEPPPVAAAHRRVNDGRNQARRNPDDSLNKRHSIIGYRRAVRYFSIPLVVAALSPSRTVALRKRLPPHLPRYSALVQTWPLRSPFLVRRFPLRGAVNN